MLPLPNLDDEDYEEIAKKAKRMIGAYHSGWTDYNEHDPGITFLELFSWLKEAQQYHINQIGKENYKKYLQLLGFSRMGCTGAKSCISLPREQEDYILPKGCVAYAGDIPFETTEQERIVSTGITQATSVRGNKTVVFRNTKEWEEGKMTFLPFGSDPEPEDQLVIDFDQPLCKQMVHMIYFEVTDDYPVKRNPIQGKPFYPLASFAYEYFDGDDWKGMDILKDETYQFLESGMLRFSLPGEMGEDKKLGGYRIRLRILSCEYEAPPVLKSIRLNMIPVLQQRTRIESCDGIAGKCEDGLACVAGSSYLAVYGNKRLFTIGSDGYYRSVKIQAEEIKNGFMSEIYFQADETMGNEIRTKLVSFLSEDENMVFLGMGDGFPSQCFELPTENTDYSRLELMIEEEGNPNAFCIWKKVEDFDASGPEDRHFVIEEEQGLVQFGNCIHGLAPEGRIYISSLVQCMGERGNVMEKRINRLKAGSRTIAVCNMEGAYGGKDGEGMEDCFHRFRMRTEDLKRAVTYQDYEKIAVSTPGLRICKAKAIPVTKMKKSDGSIDENTIYLVIEAFYAGNKRKLSRAYYENISHMLNKVRLIGSRFHILSPEYIGLSIFAEITVNVRYLNPDRLLRLAVEHYARKQLGDFGSTVPYSNIYGILDTQECVISVDFLTLDAQGHGINRSMNGDIQLPANGLLYLKEVDFSITTRE